MRLGYTCGGLLVFLAGEFKAAGVLNDLIENIDTIML